MKTTDRQWPAITTGLIRGATVLSFKDDFTKDSERLRILISMTVWSIWKSRNEKSINNRDVTPNETTGTLRELKKLELDSIHGRRNEAKKTTRYQSPMG